MTTARLPAETSQPSIKEHLMHIASNHTGSPPIVIVDEDAAQSIHGHLWPMEQSKR
jgi:hypothetical protein